MKNAGSPGKSQMLTPPRSPGGERRLGMTFSPKTSNQLLLEMNVNEPKPIKDTGSLKDDSYDLSVSNFSRGQQQKEEKSVYNEAWAKTDGALLAKAFKES
jgi:hypothetical protein